MTTDRHTTSYLDGPTLFVTVESRVMTSVESPLISNEIIDAMNEAGSGLRWIVLDVGAVSTVNSVALGMLVVTNTTALHRNVALILTGLGPFLRDIFAKTKLDRVFTICETKTEVREIVGGSD